MRSHRGAMQFPAFSGSSRVPGYTTAGRARRPPFQTHKCPVFECGEVTPVCCIKAWRSIYRLAISLHYSVVAEVVPRDREICFDLIRVSVDLTEPENSRRSILGRSRDTPGFRLSPGRRSTPRYNCSRRRRFRLMNLQTCCRTSPMMGH